MLQNILQNLKKTEAKKEEAKLFLEELIIEIYSYSLSTLELILKDI